MNDSGTACIVESLQIENRADKYAREKCFKLRVSSQDYEATLEGSYLNEPLNAMIIGRC